jgi:hypothetical protein
MALNRKPQFIERGRRLLKKTYRALASWQALTGVPGTVGLVPQEAEPPSAYACELLEWQQPGLANMQCPAKKQTHALDGFHIEKSADAVLEEKAGLSCHCQLSIRCQLSIKTVLLPKQR